MSHMFAQYSEGNRATDKRLRDHEEDYETEEVDKGKIILSVTINRQQKTVQTPCNNNRTTEK